MIGIQIGETLRENVEFFSLGSLSTSELVSMNIFSTKLTTVPPRETKAVKKTN
uniref:Uncharacterized protein n=1 Tax=Physcomitrium patens TaxID=3218 RepID=A0A2K1L7Z2_PHYPA|nr:hypothetical protein PHYPA_000570 [Physcomitrium patens]